MKRYPTTTWWKREMARLLDRRTPAQRGVALVRYDPRFAQEQLDSGPPDEFAIRFRRLRSLIRLNHY